MSTLKALAVISMLIVAAQAISMKSQVFNDLIEKTCYQRDSSGRSYTLGQLGGAGPLGQSLENFISLIEKIEQYNDRNRINWKPEIFAGALLSRFHIEENDYDPSYNVFKQESDAKYRNRIRERLLKAESLHQSDFPEDALTPDEKCSMYFMLSHHINKTALLGERSDRTYNVLRAPPSSGSRSGYPMRKAQSYNVQLTKYPREYGVVSFRNNEEHAIAPARILFGIIAGSQPAGSTMRVEELLLLSSEQSVQDLATPRRNNEIDIGLAVTLADIWAYAAIPSSVAKQSSKFGATGKWNSTYCQTEYTLNSNSSRGSLAEIRGGIDGFLIGKKVKEVLESGARFRLSSMLRMYYSPNGLFDDVVSVCRRDGVNSQLSTLREQTKNYFSAYVPLTYNHMVDDNRNMDFIDSSASQWEQALRQSMQSISDDREWCDSARDTGATTSGASANNMPCETPNDVVVIVDLNDEFTQQMDLIRSISNNLDMRQFGSSMTILANTRGGGIEYTSDGLSRVAWNSTNRGCVGCRLAWMDRANFGVQVAQPDVLYNQINATLRDLKEIKADEEAVAGKPLLLFNYGFAKKPTTDPKRFYQAKNDLRTNHRDVPLIIIGKGNKDDLDDLAYNNEDVFESDSPDSLDLASRIQKRICETPANLQHPECATRTSSNDLVSGYVTPGRKQYWSMFPEYFIKSYTVTFEFSATNGAYKVCYRRGTPKPEEDERNCKTVKPGEESVLFRSKNPCHKYGLHDCNPFYFTIIGLREGTQTGVQKCKDEKCLNMDQIKWTVSHTGISCNGSLKLAFSAFLPITLLATLVLNRLNKLFL